MNAVLKVFLEYKPANRPTWWMILECGHWYHWTGDIAPDADKDFPCPSCKPPIDIRSDL